MEHPIGISILGGLLVVTGIRGLAGIATCLAFRLGRALVLPAIVLGMTGAVLVTFVLPQWGMNFSSQFRGFPIAIFGAFVPPLLMGLIWKLRQ